MEDAPVLYHCSGPLCEDEVAQPANKFWKCQRTSFRSRGVPLYCRRCLIYLKFERVSHNLPTRFDREIARLGLAGRERAWSESKELQGWAKKNASAAFVPERLLNVWHIRPVVDL